jgi:hypothetical protein
MSKLPHIIMMLAAFVAAAITTTLSLQGHGDIALPVGVVSGLTLLNTVIGNLVDSWSTVSQRQTMASRIAERGQAPIAMLVALAGIACMILGIAGLLTDCSATPQQVATGVEVGLNAAVCVIETYTGDLAAGKSDADAVADAAIKCGVTAVQASGVLSELRAAEVRQGFVLRPLDAGGQ